MRSPSIASFLAVFTVLTSSAVLVFADLIKVDETGLTMEDVLQVQVYGDSGSSAKSGSSGANASISLPQPKPQLLSPNCNNKICTMMQYALSCKALNFGFKKICAQYFLGYLYGCSIFPPASDVFNAPSICASELSGLAALFGSGNPETGLSDLLKPYLNASTFGTNVCGRRCYQLYQNASNDFYSSCGSELSSNKSVASNYPIASAISIYQGFRNQACTYRDDIQPGMTATPANCYQEFSILASGKVPTMSTTTSAPTVYSNTIEPTFMPTANPTKPTGPLPNSFLDFNCTYSPYPDTPVANQKAYNAHVSQEYCYLFSAQGCCTGNNIARLQQNPMLSTQSVTIFPPCFLGYLSDFCRGVDLTTFCEAGSISDLSTFTANVTLPRCMSNCGTRVNPKTRQAISYPNMYLHDSVFELQTVLFLALVGANGGETNNNGTLSPLSFVITKFAYSNTAGQLTPTDGSVYYPSWGDYELSTSVTFSFQVVLQGIDSTLASDLYTDLGTPTFMGALCTLYSVAAKTGKTCRSTRGIAPLQYNATPIEFSAGVGEGEMRPTIIMTMMTILFSTVVMASLAHF